MKSIGKEEAHAASSHLCVREILRIPSRCAVLLVQSSGAPERPQNPLPSPAPAIGKRAILITRRHNKIVQKPLAKDQGPYDGRKYFRLVSNESLKAPISITSHPMSL